MYIMLNGSFFNSSSKKKNLTNRSFNLRKIKEALCKEQKASFLFSGTFTVETEHDIKTVLQCRQDKVETFSDGFRAARQIDD